MRMLPRVLLILGAVALVAAIAVLAYGGLEVWKQWIAISANRSMAFTNPVGMMIGGAALALLAGLLVGLALGMPRKPKDSGTPAAPGQPPSRPAAPNTTEATPPADPSTLR